MIGYLTGQVKLSDGKDLVLVTASGVGYQLSCQSVLKEGSQQEVYVSHVIKEASQDLYAFLTYQDKKVFEMLLGVNGVGPKSAYSLVSVLSGKGVCEAIMLENKKLLQQAPGIGPKAVAQIILDLGKKVQNVTFYNDLKKSSLLIPTPAMGGSVFQEVLMACQELGFKEAQVIPLIQQCLNEQQERPAEEVIQYVLKEV